MRPALTIRATIPALALMLIGVGSALAQVPDEFQNLKIFPKDIGRQELVHAMRGFSDALGVRCNFCHLERTPGDHNTTDWASDEKENKKVARGMMRMAVRINEDLLPAATGEHDFQVQCLTCHRGLQNPTPLDQVILQVTEEKGIEAGVAKYRELRERYYGTGSYDFSSESLGQVAETLAQEKGDLAAARKIVDLNVEMYPADPGAHVMRGQIQFAAGDREGALASLNHALELDPGNRDAKRMLEQIGGGK